MKSIYKRLLGGKELINNGDVDSHVACLNFKRSCVGDLSMFHIDVTVAVRNLKKGCHLSRFHFKCCHYFLGHGACQNLPGRAS